MKNKKGFTLIELMIVVAIIAIISAIAIPSLMKTRMQSNETAAAASLKSLSAAQSSYHRDKAVMAEDIRDLFDGSSPDISDTAIQNAVLAAAASPTTGQAKRLQADATQKAGYFYFSNHNYTGDNFMMCATPSTYGSSGRNTYFTDSSGTTYYIDYDAGHATADADTIVADYDDAGDWNADGSGGSGGAWTVAK